MALEIRKANGMLHVQKTVTIRQSASVLYQVWRSLERLPEFMQHVESVTSDADGRSHWVVTAPAGQTVEWDARILEDIPDDRITWHSVEGSGITNGGEIRFRTAPGDRGTEVRVTLVYDPPAGRAGVAIAKLFGEEPARQLDDDLYRFKQLMETGRIPSTAGQSHGARTPGRNVA